MAELEAVNARLVTDLSQKTNEKPEMHQASGFSELQTTHRCLTPNRNGREVFMNNCAPLVPEIFFKRHCSAKRCQVGDAGERGEWCGLRAS